jgi:hypothetical protein
MLSKVFAFASLLVAARAQQVGTLTTETHPRLSVSKCTSSGCTVSQQTIVLDANWRWLHSTSGATNCYTGNTWDAALCPNNVACASNCALDGADYSGTYGITTSGNSLRLNFVTKGSGTNVGSRTYLMAAGDQKYESFNLLAAEFTFTVDVSKLPCGLNGALYFSQMEADGGLAANPGNKAGAKYGTGYCDAQCPRDLKFINGKVSDIYNVCSIQTNLSHRPTLRDGEETQTLPTPERVNVVPAVTRWISGRPTPSPALSLHILATTWVLMSVLVLPAVLVTDTPPSAMLMDVISTLTAWAT